MALSESSPYLFALTNPGNEDLLKEMVKLVRPNFSFSFSKPGFCTFKKQDGMVTESDLTSFPMAYARLVGIGAKKSKSQATHFFDSEKLICVGAHEEINFIKVAENDFWEFPKQALHSALAHPFGTPEVVKPEEAPSRAYLKIAESFHIKEVVSQNTSFKRVIELGCAPGGGSHFLLSQNLEVFGIDPAEMDPEIIKGPRFHHLKSSVQSIKRNDLPGDFEILASDMNLDPKQTINYSLVILSLLRKMPRHLFITLKTADTKWCKELQGLSQKIKRGGFRHCQLIQLPSHRRETLLHARL